MGSIPAKYMDIFVFYVCFVGSGLCDELITCSEEFCCVCVRACVRACARAREREREISSNLNNVAAWARVALSRHRDGKKNLSFVCLLIGLVTPVKCVECQ